MRRQIVKELRNQHGWSQSELSSLSGLSVKTIQRLENGQGVPSLDSAKALAAVFDRPFSVFLPSTETSAEQHNDSVASTETASSQKSAEVRSNLLHHAKHYWRPTVIAVFVVTLFGLLANLYLVVETLSTEVSDLASAMTSESASDLSEGITSFTSKLQGEVGSFTDYYGDEALTHAFQALEGDEDNVGHVTLLELVMLRDTARIVTAWEVSAELNSDISTPTVLSNYLQCYSDSRTPLGSPSQSIAKMQDCIYVVLSDADWQVSPSLDQAIANVAHRMRQTGPVYKDFILPITSQNQGEY